MSISDRQKRANAIRILSADAVQKANSGHPGAPMGMADIAEVLWHDYLRHNPSNPAWLNRDRFVLSNGHGSMLLYSLLHLTGYALDKQDVENFRQFGSKTPGHPEYGYTPGVETTTGPLGQGVANAVGMAIAEKTLAAQFNTSEHSIIDHYTYVFLGDGCLMEGISHEACSLAGTLGLSKLIVFWDDNGISIDGEVQAWFSDDTKKRFESYGWHVVDQVDGHDADSIRQAIDTARKQSDKPSLICCKTVIGKGSPNKQGSENCHGSPLGVDELKQVRQNLQWEDEPFFIPQEIAAQWNKQTQGAQWESDWQTQFDDYQRANPTQCSQLLRRIKGDLPESWEQHAEQIINKAHQAEQTLATRKSSLLALNEFGPLLPELIGGSADLASSNYTIWDHSKAISADSAEGNYIYYGVREFAMSAISNGIALYGGFRPYAATFLVFADYMRNGMRMSALMKQPVTYVLTHDSIGLGEDGPTHQPIEHVASLRLIPNMSVWRPCDTVETMVAWQHSLESKDKPTSLILSRQNCEYQGRTDIQKKNIAKGGYVLMGDSADAQLILIATGSEVGLAVSAARMLQAQGVKVSVVSMPSCDVFDAQDEQYKQSVLPGNVTQRIAIEAGSKAHWYKYVGINGEVIGMDSFGESAPAETLFEHFGFTLNNVVQKAKALLSE